MPNKSAHSLIVALFFCASACLTLHADTFTFKVAEVGELIDQLAALDGYDQAVDQGPGNPAKVIHSPFKFSRETRAKLGADRAALVKAANDLNDKLSDIRLKISGDANKIDDKDKEQIKLWTERTKPLLNLTVELSPVTADELTVNDNPVPISTLSVLNKLRAQPAAVAAK